MELVSIKLCHHCHIIDSSCTVTCTMYLVCLLKILIIENYFLPLHAILCLLSQLPPIVKDGGDYSHTCQSDGPSQIRFSELKEEEFESVAQDIESQWKGAANISADDIMR